MLDFQASRYAMKGEVAKQRRNFHPTSPSTGMFQARQTGSSTYCRLGRQPVEEVLRGRRRQGASGLGDFATVNPRQEPPGADRASQRCRAARSRASSGSLYMARPASRAERSTRSTRSSPTRRSSISKSAVAGPIIPISGTFDIVGQPIPHEHYHPQPEAHLKPAPDQGQHTDEVLREAKLRQDGDRRAAREGGAI